MARAAPWTVAGPECEVGVDVDCNVEDVEDVVEGLEEGTRVIGAGLLDVADTGVGVGVGEGSAWGAAAVVDAALDVLSGMVTVCVVRYCVQAT